MFTVNTGVNKQERGKTHMQSRQRPNHRFGREEKIEFSKVMLGFVDLLVCKKMAHMLVGGGGIRPGTENFWRRQAIAQRTPGDGKPRRRPELRLC